MIRNDSLLYLHGVKFCIVYMTVLDAAAKQVQVQPFHGVARVLPDRLVVEDDSGEAYAVPDSALHGIRKSDGKEPLLADAEYFVIVKIGTRLPD